VAGLQKHSVSEENAVNKEEEERLFRTTTLCCDARVARSEDGISSFVGDPTETALVAVAYGMGLSEEGYCRVAEIPFDSERKKMTTVTRKPSGKGYSVNVKGGLDEIIAGCKYIQDGNSVREITSDDLDVIDALNISMANDALRVLAMAYKEIDYIPTEKECKPEILENALIFLGMTGMIDPERPEVKDAVVECGKAGIRPVMITGDHKNTAVAIARKIGILRYGDRAVTGAEIQAMSDEDLEQNVEDISVYARVAPEHKVRIVNAWQKKGKVVAMTGDGVNDAPALKQADIGTAMGITGTDVAKDASDMVLTDDNFATIVSAVEEGRRIYDNIVKSILFLLSSNIGEIILLFVASVFNLGIPLLPIQILWINLVTDSLPALALSMDPAERGIMSRPPKDSSKGLMRGGMVWRMLYQGFLIGIVPLVAYLIGLNHAGPEIANTMAFVTLIMSELFQVRNLHSNKECSFRFSLAYNKYLTGAILFSAVLALILVLIPGLRVVFHFVALDGLHWLMAIGLALVPNFIVNVFKILGFNGKE
jgi:Ca2+-transporting ATPase